MAQIFCGEDLKQQILFTRCCRVKHSVIFHKEDLFISLTLKGIHFKIRTLSNIRARLDWPCGVFMYFEVHAMCRKQRSGCRQYFIQTFGMIRYVRLWWFSGIYTLLNTTWTQNTDLEFTLWNIIVIQIATLSMSSCCQKVNPMLSLCSSYHSFI